MTFIKNQSCSSNLMSVVITCFREGKLLYEAVRSVKEQTLKPKEIIIVNDKSPDPETNQVCYNLENDPDITLIWQSENCGPSVARNRGYEVATGEILIPLDADDLLPPNALQLIYDTCVRQPEIGFVYGHYLRYDRPHKPAKYIKPNNISLSCTLKAKPFSVSSNWKLLGSGPIRKSLWESLQGYDHQFGVKDLHDLEFWLRALHAGTSYEYIPKPIYIWRKYLGGNTQQVTPMAWYRIAIKYFDVYQSVGLRYRAIELILLGAKWQNNQPEIRHYSQQLITCILASEFQLSSLVILITPAWLIRWILKKGVIRR
jgi:glycosyltransferase involved in cell wall biosynthesis